MDWLRVADVLDLVRQIPPGQVASYGDVAAIVGTGPRQVGRVMAMFGSDAPWWRVVSAAGTLPDHLLMAARDHWQAEGIGIRPDGSGCLITRHRADLSELLVANDEVSDGTAPDLPER